MARSEHVLDLVAEDLAQWIDDTAQQLADAMSEGGTSPFAARTTADERLAYYRRQFFNPDGSPNPQGRDEEHARLGDEGFLKALRTVIDAGPTASAGPPEALHPLMPDWLRRGVPPPPMAPAGR
jgi:hypothetical protein